MYLVKFAKLFNTLRPFFAEIFSAGEDGKDNVSRNKGLTVITVVVAFNVFLFSNEIVIFNPPWNRESDGVDAISHDRTSKDPNKVWLDFLEQQLTDHVEEISELEDRLSKSETARRASRELNKELEQEIRSLKNKISFLKGQIARGASSRDIYEKLKELEENKDDT